MGTSLESRSFANDIGNEHKFSKYFNESCGFDSDLLQMILEMSMNFQNI